ncbi:hypothetical protein GCM10010458_14590 [Microbacterium luteolum]|uniref:Uncharacterized protein n=2 Tax=Microbacterium TaxID=33882 RepID=A0AAU7W365_9MICO|nr:hypothetical protein [Microbacterium luteolum]WDM44178.1 hypothetical protein KV395_13385 [Microbacterium luteolum]
MPMPDETTSVSLAWGKSLLGVAALIFSVSIVLAAGEWWQFVTFGVMVLLGVVLLVSGVRDIVASRREKQVSRDEVTES